MSDGGFNALMAATDSAMVVVTTVAEDEPAGCLVGFHSQSSMSPQHYCIWLSKANHTYRVGLRATHFAVHFLSEDDLAVAEHFGTRSGEDSDKFTGLDVDIDDHGVPLLRACPNRMVVERIAMLDDGGDHACITTEVQSAESSGAFTPLRLSDTTSLDAGQPSENRAIQPEG